MKKKLVLLFLLLSFVRAEFEEPPAFFEPDKKYRYLLMSNGVLFATAVAAFGTLLLLPESITNWSDEDIANLGTNYVKKVNLGPVIDKDKLYLNYLAHPYVGAIYYMQPRTAGFSWTASAFYSFLFSTFFWEYGLEAFAEIPSWQDLILTPALGSLIGEGFYQASRYIQNHHGRLWNSKFLGTIALMIMDPIGFIMRDMGLAKAVGIKNKNIITATIPQKEGFVASIKIIW
ncbi:DUF3943 domain-containing protein [Helicobacter anatolicus]|uniref:DUF3943 domain-containing protein n=1 Tax=Helicobacter anatolicus TaxID=2905874 RepID=UPI001E5E721A|nr:DUF3943 domain-containing protein [Helicobacter anatolicus]MCE3037278.1 DUF3943 domain-containing protein [Helicobacter anatolicus]MCE3039596.1 DUF3943 domain-containing protein [Helicobacter anatolicus]